MHNFDFFCSFSKIIFLKLKESNGVDLEKLKKIIVNREEYCVFFDHFNKICCESNISKTEYVANSEKNRKRLLTVFIRKVSVFKCNLMLVTYC